MCGIVVRVRVSIVFNESNRNSIEFSLSTQTRKVSLSTVFTE